MYRKNNKREGSSLKKNINIILGKQADKYDRRFNFWTLLLLLTESRIKRQHLRFRTRDNFNKADNLRHLLKIT